MAKWIWESPEMFHIHDVGETERLTPLDVREARRLAKMVHDTVDPLPWAESIECAAPSEYLPQPTVFIEENNYIRDMRMLAVDQAINTARKIAKIKRYKELSSHDVRKAMSPKELSQRIHYGGSPKYYGQSYKTRSEFADCLEDITPAAELWLEENQNSWSLKKFHEITAVGTSFPKLKKLDGIAKEDSDHVHTWVRDAVWKSYYNEQSLKTVIAMLLDTFYEEPESENKEQCD